MFSQKNSALFDHLLDKSAGFYYYAKRNSKSTSPHKHAMRKHTHTRRAVYLVFHTFDFATFQPALIVTKLQNWCWLPYVVCEITASTLAPWQLLYISPCCVNYFCSSPTHGGAKARQFFHNVSLSHSARFCLAVQRLLVNFCFLSSSPSIHMFLCHTKQHVTKYL